MAYTDEPEVATPVHSEEEAKEQARKDLIELLQKGEVVMSVEVGIMSFNS
jgi:hypothetical protein